MGIDPEAEMRRALAIVDRLLRSENWILAHRMATISV
jgi:hypothetical protein